MTTNNEPIDDKTILMTINTNDQSGRKIMA